MTKLYRKLSDLSNVPEPAQAIGAMVAATAETAASFHVDHAAAAINGFKRKGGQASLECIGRSISC